LIIPMIIQTILLDPSGAIWTDGPSNVSRLDPSGAIQADAEHPSRSRKVVVVRSDVLEELSVDLDFLDLPDGRYYPKLVPLEQLT
jgi:hypothetical protein